MTTISNYSSAYTYNTSVKTNKDQAYEGEDAGSGTTKQNAPAKVQADAEESISSSLNSFRLGALDTFLQFLLDSIGEGKSQTLGTEGNDTIRSYDGSVVDGLAGDDAIDVYDHSYVDGGDGNDTISTYDHAVVIGGDGDDKIGTYDHSYILGGGGNDRISTYDHSVVDGGSGDDRISGYDHSDIRGGEGNDLIDVYDHSTVDGGGGNDEVHTYGYADVSGGDGDDTINTGDYSTIDGGTGNDRIHTGGYSTVTGGEGDDVISAGLDSVIKFKGGDGHEAVLIFGWATVVLGDGLSGETMQVSLSGNKATITFDGNTNDSITVEFGPYGVDETTTLTVAFPDGTTQEIKPESLRGEPKPNPLADRMMDITLPR